MTPPPVSVDQLNELFAVTWLRDCGGDEAAYRNFQDANRRWHRLLWWRRLLLAFYWGTAGIALYATLDRRFPFVVALGAAGWLVFLLRGSLSALERTYSDQINECSYVTSAYLTGFQLYKACEALAEASLKVNSLGELHSQLIRYTLDTEVTQRGVSDGLGPDATGRRLLADGYVISEATTARGDFMFHLLFFSDAAGHISRFEIRHLAPLSKAG